MKFVKLSIFALTMGLFIASCGNSESTEGTTTDSVVTEAPAADMEPAPAPAPADTMTAAPADSAAAPAPAH
ncbi:MAG TPA: hypothetical protein VEB40_01775 [Flavipsychrobacter sp.]|nr:hypothetical protein [Flavipsychrobacter sp.]